LLGLVWLRLFLFRLLRMVFRLFIAGWRKRVFVAGLLAGLRLRPMLVFIAGQIFRCWSFAHHIFDRSLRHCLSGCAFNWIDAGTFVGINFSFFSVNFDP